MKKIKITESQLKTLMERKHSYQEETNEETFDDMDQINAPEETDEVEETEVMNESIEKIKTNFKRFL